MTIYKKLILLESVFFYFINKYYFNDKLFDEYLHYITDFTTIELFMIS